MTINMKKNIFFVVALSIVAMLFSSFTTYDLKNDCNATTSLAVFDDESSLVFRGTQKFRNSRDNVEIYCYTNGRCEWYDGDRRIVTCTYTYSDGEIRFLDENGDTIYKGSVSWNNTHSKPLSITINGTTYRNKD